MLFVPSSLSLVPTPLSVRGFAPISCPLPRFLASSFSLLTCCHTLARTAVCRTRPARSGSARSRARTTAVPRASSLVRCTLVLLLWAGAAGPLTLAPRCVNTPPVYDVCRRDTFESLDTWFNELQTYSSSDDIVKMVVGNKIDEVRLQLRSPCPHPPIPPPQAASALKPVSDRRLVVVAAPGARPASDAARGRGLCTTAEGALHRVQCQDQGRRRAGV